MWITESLVWRRTEAALVTRFRHLLLRDHLAAMSPPELLALGHGAARHISSWDLECFGSPAMSDD
jgi:hypothetical protein